MKYLNELTKYKVFNKEDFSTMINDDNLAKILLQNYLEKAI